MKSVLFLALLCCVSAFSQDSLVLKKNGFEPIVVEVKGKSAEEIYTKAKEWIQLYYKNPNYVLSADIDSKMIRLDGFEKNGYSSKSLGMQLNNGFRYQLILDFKDGKYLFTIRITELVSSNGVRNFYDIKDFFGKDGLIKEKYAISAKTLTNTVRSMQKSLDDYINGKSEKKW